MKEKTLKIETVHQCNCCLGSKTLHPLVSVIDLSKKQLVEYHDIKSGCYTLLLNECSCETFIYGRKYYDFSNGSLVCLTPGQSVNIENCSENLPTKGWMLVFHPDLICGTSLGQIMSDYTFFSYRQKEALHLSAREKQTVLEYLDKIDLELKHYIDSHSKRIISKHIELLLDYCTRFYERQFITRHEANLKIIERFNTLLEKAYETKNIPSSGMPTTIFCADKLDLSVNYFCDMLKVEKGKSVQEYIQLKRFELAKNWLQHTDKSILQIAKELGFQSSECFSHLFRKITGSSPTDFRTPN